MGRSGSFLDCGVPHPGCFAQRVRKMQKIMEIANWAAQKSSQEYEKKGGARVGDRGQGKGKDNAPSRSG